MASALLVDCVQLFASGVVTVFFLRLAFSRPPPPPPLQRSMPLCMKQLHSALNREHKLKHWGRLQYGLFLKGAGLGVDDAMAFWQVKYHVVRYQLPYATTILLALGVPTSMSMCNTNSKVTPTVKSPRASLPHFKRLRNNVVPGCSFARRCAFSLFMAGARVHLPLCASWIPLSEKSDILARHPSLVDARCTASGVYVTSTTRCN